MIIRAQLVKLRRNLSSSSANQHTPSSSTNQTPTPRVANGGGGDFLFALPSASLSPYFSLSLTTRHLVFSTAALIFLRGRQTILKATITAQNYQFPLQLTLWEERGRGRGRGERRMGSEIQIWDEESHLGPLLLPPTSSPQGAVMCLG